MENKLPIVACKQAILKFESALADINEILEECPDEMKEDFQIIAGYTGAIISRIYNQVKEVMNEDEFISETIEMENIGLWPGEHEDIMNDKI